MRGVTGVYDFNRTVDIQFQPALPMRGVTQERAQLITDTLFQPALPMRGVTRGLARSPAAERISTRTPHAGSDSAIFAAVTALSYFNPHSPCGE